MGYLQSGLKRKAAVLAVAGVMCASATVLVKLDEEAIKPSLPQLMPRIGFFPAAAASANLSIVPSPPITATISQLSIHFC